jgi:hypothetical protein
MGCEVARYLFAIHRWILATIGGYGIPEALNGLSKPSCWIQQSTRVGKRRNTNAAIVAMNYSFRIL